MKPSKSWLFLFIPIAVGILGSLSNAVVCVVNHGQMPVLAVAGVALDKLQDWNHVIMSAHTHLNFLADWMVHNGGISSLGDLLIDASQDLTVPSILAWLD